MKLVRIEENIKDDVLLIPIGDCHIGSKDCDYSKLKKTVDWVKGKKNARVVLMGDLVDIGLKDSIGAGTFDNDSTPSDQIETVVDLFTPIKDKIWCSLPGNHESVTKNTEILTKSGWKNVTTVTKEDLVGQFDIETNNISFANPLELVNHFAKEIIELESNNMKQCVTLNHDIIINKNKIKAKELLNKKITQNEMPLVGNYYSSGVDIEDDIIKLLTWVIMDGTMIDYRKYVPNSIKRVIQFKLSKERKINKLRELLNSMDINYTFRKATKSESNTLQPYYIRIYGDEARKIFSFLHDKKEIPYEWKNFNKKQTKIVLDTLIDTDGHKTFNHINWRTTSKNNMNIISNMCILNGYNFKYTIRENASGYTDNCLPQYDCSIFESIQNNKVCITKKQYNDMTYCFTMPKGTLITRLDGKTAFTGNCRIKDRTSIDISKLIAKSLDVPYTEGTCFIKAKINKENYIIFATHGSSGSGTASGKLNAIMKYGSYLDADLYMMGHVHELMHHTTDYFKVDKGNKMIVKDKHHYVVTGHFLKYGGYAEAKGYAPGKSGVAKIRLSGTEKKVNVSI